jgi:hypothetical protein
MANKVNWDSSPAITAYLTTELNTLANAARVIGGAIDNSANLNMYMDVEFVIDTQVSTRLAGCYIGVYLVTSVDGTNYGYGDATTQPPANALVCALQVDVAVTARRLTSKPFLIPPGKMMLVFENNTGYALKATGNTAGYRVYSEEIQ